MTTLAPPRLAVILGLLAALAAAKLVYNPALTRNSIDAGYYFQTARHVAEGDGLVTSVSLYNQGLHPLPHPSNIYPLWPLSLGHVARIVGQKRAAHGLPEVLFLLDVALIYLLANRLARAWGDTADVLARIGRLEIDVGHAAAALLGTNHVFFRTTSVPYTEGLAFACMFGTLLAAHHAVATGRLRWALLAGALGGATYLCRMQLLVVPAGLIAALGIAGLRDRFARRAAVAALAGAALVCLPWLLHLASFVREFSLAMFVDFSAYREAPGLEPLRQMVKTDSLGALIADRARGVWVAFRPFGPHSYLRSLGPSIYLLPLALFPLLRRPKAVRAALELRHAPVLAALLAGLGAMASVHVMHMRLDKPWLFGWRHGLPVVLLVILALAYLRARGGRALSLVAALLVAGSLATQTWKLASEVRRRRPGNPNAAERALSRWLNAHSPHPTVVTTNPQWLSVHSRAGFHWTHCTEPAEQTRRLLEIGADYVVVLPGQRNCRFVRGLLPSLDVIATFGDGPRRIELLGPRRGTDPKAHSETPPASHASPVPHQTPCDPVEPDERGLGNPVPFDEFVDIEGDTVIYALGTKANPIVTHAGPGAEPAGLHRCRRGRLRRLDGEATLPLAGRRGARARGPLTTEFRRHRESKPGLL